MRDTYETLCNVVEDTSADDAIGTIANILRDKRDDDGLTPAEAETLENLEKIGY